MFVLRLVLIFNMCLFNVDYCTSFQITTLFKKFKISKGIRLSGHVMSTFNPSSSIECAMACTDELACISYNLINDNGARICELNSNGLDDVFVDDVRSSYSGSYIYLVCYDLVTSPDSLLTCFCPKIIETVVGMLYVVGKIFL